MKEIGRNCSKGRLLQVMSSGFPFSNWSKKRREGKCSRRQKLSQVLFSERRKENNNHIFPSSQDSSSSASSHSETWKIFFQFNISPKESNLLPFFHVFLRLSYHKLFAIDVWWSKILGAIFRLQRFQMWCENIQSEIRAFASLFASQRPKENRAWMEVG